jgi:hypothetical protein
MSGSRSSSGGGFGALPGLLLLIGFVIKEYSRYWDGLAARADEQHNWVLQGDDRGIYGTEGAELMHHLYRARDRVKRLGRER